MGAKYNKLHGLSRTRLYRIYNNMKSRCYKPYAKEYEVYSGNGRSICLEWLDEKSGFVNFYNWAMANGYRDDLTLERIDNNKGYSPDNCKWATLKEQQNNKSNNRIITYNGEAHNIAEWVEIIGIPRNTLVKRLNSGWEIEDALTKPVDKSYSHCR